jgi:hypothetical protein
MKAGLLSMKRMFRKEIQNAVYAFVATHGTVPVELSSVFKGDQG